MLSCDVVKDLYVFSLSCVFKVIECTFGLCLTEGRDVRLNNQA